jgi:hypothetical protein
MNKPLPEYKTTDIVMAAFLAMHGHHVTIEVARSKGTFTFTNIPRELVIDFTNGVSLVEPMAFALKMRQLISSVRQRVNDDRFINN